MNNTEEKDVVELNIKALLADSGLYSIPVYQRNYAWGEAQIKQLIRDVIDSLPRQGEVKKYYIGTLIVDKTVQDSKDIYETIDGQQRLTTLNIIATAIKNNPDYNHIDMSWLKQLNLSFTNRKLSTAALNVIFNDSKVRSVKYNTSITDAYVLVNKIIKNELIENKVTINSFANYLFNYVTILRVSVPPKTDLNHYFEIMNSNGWLHFNLFNNQ